MSHLPPALVIEDDVLFTEFHGAFTENLVAQTLATEGYPLYYWTSEGIAEVDLIVSQDMQIYPLEIKAGMSRQKRSLLVYANKYQPPALLRGSRMNLKKEGNVCNISLYLISRFADISISS